jgi:hypothetical protein
VHKVLVKKLEEHGTLGRSRRRLENNIKVDFYEVERRHGMNLSGSGLKQVAGPCKCGKGTSFSIKCRKILH